jgi:ABC-type amino acid transport substrate-binding protein
LQLWKTREAIRLGVVAAVACGLLASRSAPATARPSAAASPPTVAVPSFWDPKRRQERPELTANTVIRFMTEIDYPPFNFAGPDGNPSGFNVDLARAICEELKVGCTVQMRRFDTLIDALSENRGDAVVASIAKDPTVRQRVDSPIPIIARRRGSWRSAGANFPRSLPRSSPARASPSSAEPRTRLISSCCSRASTCARIPATRRHVKP